MNYCFFRPPKIRIPDESAGYRLLKNALKEIEVSSQRLILTLSSGRHGYEKT
jgi:hypothetical protein